MTSRPRAAKRVALADGPLLSRLSPAVVPTAAVEAAGATVAWIFIAAPLHASPPVWYPVAGALGLFALLFAEHCARHETT